MICDINELWDIVNQNANNFLGVKVRLLVGFSTVKTTDLDIESVTIVDSSLVIIQRHLYTKSRGTFSHIRPLGAAGALAVDICICFHDIES